MTDTSPPPPPAPPAPFVPRPGLLDTAGRLCVSAMCRECGYNLRGLLPDSTCPECGHAVAPSLETELLSFADHDWLVTLARGLRWLRAGAICLAACGALGMFGASLPVLLSRIPGLATLATMPMVVAEITLLLTAPPCCAVLTRAAWLLTAAEPGTRRPRQQRFLRACVRWPIGTSFALLVSAIALAAHGVTAASVVATITVGVTPLAGGLIALFHRLIEIARRVPDQPASRHAAGARRPTAALLVGLLVVGALTLFRTGDPMLLWATALFVAAALVGIAERALRLSHGLIRRLDELIALQRHSTPPE